MVRSTLWQRRVARALTLIFVSHFSLAILKEMGYIDCEFFALLKSKMDFRMCDAPRRMFGLIIGITIFISWEENEANGNI